MKLPQITGASRTVLVMLLAIAFLELGVSKRFGQIWNLAFTPTPNKEPITAPGETPQNQSSSSSSNPPPPSGTVTM